MRPRNEREREVCKLYKRMPCLSKPQAVWIEKEVVKGQIVWSGRQGWCTHCGKTLKEGEGNCPECGAGFPILNSRKTSLSGFEYVNFIQVYKGWQVIRYYLVKWFQKKGEKQRVEIHDIFQVWCQPGRPAITLGVPLGMNCYWRQIPFSMWGGLSIKDNYANSFYTEWFKVKTYPRMTLLSVYTKNLGKSPDFATYDAPTLLGNIFGNPYLESLWKTGNTEELQEMLKYINQVNAFWPSLKVALRHGFRPNNWWTYWEHLRCLKFLHYDMRSPRYVAPKDFGELHNLITRQYKNKAEAIQRKREETLALKRAIAEEEYRKMREEDAKKCEASFSERIAHFADLKIEDGDLVISPLMSIQAFREEGDAMHHCVFNFAYYKHTDSLILSARTRAKNERVETIEVDIKNFTIRQSQGICNNPTDQHEKILSLVTGAMPQIRAMAATL